MLFKMIRGVLFHQRGKMLLIAFTIALGASLATGMLNVMWDVGDKVNQELKTYGANIVVKPKDSSLLSEIYDTGEGEQLSVSYLKEEDTVSDCGSISAGRDELPGDRELVQPSSFPAYR